MIVLVDTNVIIDFLMTREPFYKASAEVITKCAGKELIKAIKMAEFKDFEECLQDRCVENIKAEYIITRNVKDFEGSTVQAVPPEKFLEITS